MAEESRASPGSSKLGDAALSPGILQEQVLRVRFAPSLKERNQDENNHAPEQPERKRQKLDDASSTTDGKQGSLKGNDKGATTPDDDAHTANERPASSAEEEEPYKRARTWHALRRSSHPAIGSSRSIYSYERLNHIQEGTYGVVFRARPCDSSPPPHQPSTAFASESESPGVAVKKLKLQKDGLDRSGFPITSLREIQALTLARQHTSVIRLFEVCVGKTLDQIFLVMEFMEHDLKTLLTSLHKARTCFAPSEVKSLLFQLLTATKELHEDWILHRDLKTSNLLMDNRGNLKVADFGLARRFGDPIEGWVAASEPRRSQHDAGSSTLKSAGENEDGGMTDLVVTLWYRAPELLLLNNIHLEREKQADILANNALRQRVKRSHVSLSDASSSIPTYPKLPLYDEKIDMWSIGCIFAELLLTRQTGGCLFQGKDERDQLRRIRQVLGAPNTTIWPDLPLFQPLPRTNPQSATPPSASALKREEQRIKHSLQQAFHPTRLTPSTLDLLFHLLHYDPKQRIGAKAALQHEYFTMEPPMMAHPDSFGSFPSVAKGERAPYDTPSAPHPNKTRDVGRVDDRISEKAYPMEFDFNL